AGISTDISLLKKRAQSNIVKFNHEQH
ncbi:MAG: hypothetical protein RL748_1702, partial [Pseudomonadota bacterium]